MKAKNFYQLMNVSRTGIETPVLRAPGIPVEPFELKREAVAFAEGNPELIRNGRFPAKPIMILQEDATVQKVADTASEEE